MPAAALRALLEHAIDYAGLFPPADLALEPALENQAGYVRSPDRWMLGAFILPVGKFNAAAAQLGLFSRGSSAADFRPRAEERRARQLSRNGPSPGSVDRTFSGAHPDVLSITQFEMPLPEGAEPESLGNFPVFWETPADSAPATIAALAGTGAGFKLRTGGVTADAFPTDEQIARALVAAAKHQVPIKFTAGLASSGAPFHESVRTKMHGFLNVLGAGVLAVEHGWDEEQTAQMLADENPPPLGSMTSVPLARVGNRHRANQGAPSFVTSLGSCSFDEPRDDLRALGLF